VSGRAPAAALALLLLGPVPLGALREGARQDAQEAVRLRLESSRPARDGARAWEILALVGAQEETVLEIPLAEGTLRLRLLLTPQGAGGEGTALRYQADGRILEDDASWRAVHRSLELRYGEAAPVPLYDSVVPGRRVGGRLAALERILLREEAPPAPAKVQLAASLVRGAGEVLESLPRSAAVGEEIVVPMRGEGAGRWADVQLRPLLLMGEDLFVEILVFYSADAGERLEARQISQTRLLGPRDTLLLEGFRDAAGEEVRLELAWRAERPAAR